MIRQPPSFPPFPSTTLFQSGCYTKLGKIGIDVRRSFRVDRDVAGRALGDLRAHDQRSAAAIAGVTAIADEVVRDAADRVGQRDRKSTRLNSSHGYISYAVFC